MQASKQLSYSVLESFRFAGRNYEPGQVFNARRVDPNRTQLRRWLDEGLLGPLGQEAAEEPEPDAPEGDQEPDVEPEEGEAEGDEELDDPEEDQG